MSCVLCEFKLYPLEYRFLIKMDNNQTISVLSNEEFWGSAITYDAILKRWNGSTWVKAKLMNFNGSIWINKPLKYYDGATFKVVNTTGI